MYCNYKHTFITGASRAIDIIPIWAGYPQWELGMANPGGINTSRFHFVSENSYKIDSSRVLFYIKKYQIV